MSNNEQMIAIVGTSMCFPGASNIEQFWESLSNGQENIQFFSEQDMLDAGVKPERLAEPNYIRAKGIIDEAEYFDAELFGMSDDRATLMDPQHRVFIQKCWAALDDAGYDPTRIDASIGLFGGCAINTYLLNNLRHADRALTRKFQQIEFLIMTDKDFLTTQTSYLLGLNGPSVTVQTACSTAMVSIHYACESLLSGESDMALAGAATVYAPQIKGYLYEKGSIVSDDGHVRSFDARGKGTVYSSGAAVVVLKRLSQAIEDNDNILSIIRSTAVNNDGMRKGGFRMPSADGIAEAASQAIDLAGIDVDQIGMIEANGSATPLGDPIEVEALRRAYGNGELPAGAIPIGSVKSNLGHMNVTAGMGALLKTVLSLRHGQVPPSLHYETPNPQIDFEKTPFRVATELENWPDRDGPRIAGVNVYGVGGTNAHAILQQPPEIAERGRSAVENHLLLVSAASIPALERSKAQLADAITVDTDLGDVAYTLSEGRRRMAYRCYAIARRTDSGGVDIQWSGNSDNVELEAACCVLVAPTKLASTTATTLSQLTKNKPEVYVGHYRDALAYIPEFAAQTGTDDSLADIPPLMLQAVDIYAGIQTLQSYGVCISQMVASGVAAIVANAIAGNLELAGALELCRIAETVNSVDELPESMSQLIASQVSDEPAFELYSPSGSSMHWDVSDESHAEDQFKSILSDINQAADWNSSSMQFSTDLPLLEFGGLEPGELEFGGADTQASSIAVNPAGLDSHHDTLAMAGDLWMNGVKLEWGSLYGSRSMRRISLPSYPFERSRHWVDIPSSSKSSNYDVAL